MNSNGIRECIHRRGHPLTFFEAMGISDGWRYIFTILAILWAAPLMAIAIAIITTLAGPIGEHQPTTCLAGSVEALFTTCKVRVIGN